MSKRLPAEWRRRTGLSQCAAAARAEISPGAALRIETGRGVNAESIEAYGRALGAPEGAMYRSWVLARRRHAIGATGSGARRGAS